MTIYQCYASLSLENVQQAHDHISPDTTLCRAAPLRCPTVLRSCSNYPLVH
jgi:hypothetical protein